MDFKRLKVEALENGVLLHQYPIPDKGAIWGVWAQVGRVSKFMQYVKLKCYTNCLLMSNKPNPAWGEHGHGDVQSNYIH